MTDTYEGKPIAEMTREELEKALLDVLHTLEELHRKDKRKTKFLAVHATYDGEL